MLSLDFTKLDPMDILDYAIYIESEAEDNYDQLEAWMRNEGNTTSADFFRRMAKLEALHREQLAEQRQRLFGDAQPKHTHAWGFEVEVPNWDKARESMTLIEALSLSREAEERAYDFYAEALEHVDDEGCQKVLESLRDSEIEHKRLINREIERLQG
jgi:rubrerythrin